MSRREYAIFSPGNIAGLTLKNRLVRSATWDPSILRERSVNDETVTLYRRLAAGGVAMIITGDFTAVPRGALDIDAPVAASYSYEDVRIQGYSRLIAEVKRTSPDCKIVAQISAEYTGVSPSGVKSPFEKKAPRVLSADHIKTIAECLAMSIAGARDDGFDGVQLHAAHGGLLSRFLSPYSNRRRDRYGGQARNRARIICEAVVRARALVGNYPILIKMNGTDYLESGITPDDFVRQVLEMKNAGVDAVEVSGGMRDCLTRPERELGFPPVFPPESQTRLHRLDRQSYFLEYARLLKSVVPTILVGGNRDVERLETMIRDGDVDFVSMCRPLICEPDLPDRWLRGAGNSGTACKSCNCCIYDQLAGCRAGTPGIPRCILMEAPERVKEARNWLTSFAQRSIN